MYFLAQDGSEKSDTTVVPHSTSYFMKDLNTDINYSFYIITFNRKEGSNPSEIVTCTPSKNNIFCKIFINGRDDLSETPE